MANHSPHKFRHGHAVYALSRAQDVTALKAVSQNLMHENLSITDGVYGVLSDTGVKTRILELASKQNAISYDADKLIELLKITLIELQRPQLQSR